MKSIDGKYQVVETLGAGFGGEVYLVEHAGSRIALKKLRYQANHEIFSPAELLGNFKKEFSTLKKLTHPHILRILDFGYDAGGQDYYFTTEFIKGWDIFEATRALSSEQIEHLFVQTLRALGYLHRQGIVHFDLKPANILVTQDDEGAFQAKIIDFGLAAFQKKGVLAGSPPYISPEALMDQPKDGRSDLYSLGVTWYQCLTGENPFAAKDLRKTLELHRTWMPPPVSTQGMKIPKYLDAVLEKMLRKNPAERYHRADQVIRDLNWSGGKNYPLETEATALSYLPGEGQLVGREAELQLLLEAFERVFLIGSENKACVLISGGSGTGKTRLLSELKYHAQLQTICVHDLSGLNPGEINSDTLLLADNAKLETIELAKQWMQRFSTHSFLIVLAGREFAKSPLPATQLHLGNLTKSDVHRYTASILGVEDPPDFLVDALHVRTEGNPLFLTDMLQSLIRSHQIFDDQGRWSMTHLQDLGVNFQSLAEPSTLSDYFQLKYDLLSENCKKLSVYAAISRLSLDFVQIRMLNLDISREEWENAEQEKLFRLDPVSQNVSFINPSYEDWILNHFSAEFVSGFHQALSETYSAIPEQIDEQNYHRAYGTEPQERRFTYLVECGETMTRKFNWLEAARLYENAAAIAPTPHELVKVNLCRSRVLYRVNRRADAIRILEETREILKQEKSNPEHWRWVQKTNREMVGLYLKKGRLDLAREALQASMALLDEHQDDLVEKMILENYQASILMREGKLHDALEICEKTQSAWEKLPSTQKANFLNNELGNIYLAQGKALEAKNFYLNLENFCQEVGDHGKRASALYGAAESCYFLKEFREASRLYHECAELSRKLKNEEFLFHVYNGMGNLAYCEQNWAEAAKCYQEALELSQHFLDTDSTVGIAINLAAVLHFQGDVSSSLIYLNHVVESLETQTPPSLHQVQFLARAYLELGHLYLETEQNLQARDAYRDATRLVRVYPALEKYRYSSYRGLAECDIRLNQYPEAEIVLSVLEKAALSPQQKNELAELMECVKDRPDYLQPGN